MTVNIIAGNRKIDEFMHKLDLFESFKRLGDNLSFDYDGNTDPFKMLEVTKKSLEEGGYVVTALWIAQEPDINWVDWEVRCVSNGKGWYLLAEYLKQFGIVKKEPAAEGCYIPYTEKEVLDFQEADAI